ncbi:MAG: Lrp/AsnC family transcriptional regulator [Candidatus Hermodarchaeota archaeon]
MLLSTDELDKRDFDIIRLLQKDCRASLSKIAEDLDISHVTVGRRLERLITSGHIKPTLALNPTKFDFYLSITLMEVESREDIDTLVDQFKDCPRILSIMNATGSYNLILTSIAENRDTLESMAGHCSPRTQRKVRRSETLLCTPVTNTFLTIPLAPTSENERCNCGLNCLDCSAYTSERCLGCPGKPYYRSD